jgi:hypothetical protein
LGRRRKKSLGPLADPLAYYQLVAWLGFAGTESPAYKGRQLWRAEQEKAKTKRHPCPCPEYAQWMLGPVAVADRFYGGRLDLAEALAVEMPQKFAMLLQFARAEKEAEPLQMEFAEREAKRKAGVPAKDR